MGHSTIAVSGNAGFSAQNLLSLVIVTGRMGHDLRLINVAFSTLHFRSIVWYKHNVHVTRAGCSPQLCKQSGWEKKNSGSFILRFQHEDKSFDT